MIVLKPPTPIYFITRPEDTVIIFLAGSIEMDTAEKWQDRACKLLEDYDNSIVVLNPRRDSWDSNWEQNINNKEFKKQVEWELDGLDIADIVIFYFDPNTKSPITLLELGLMAERKEIATDAGFDKIIYVICPEGYWRKGNVDIICERYGITQLNNLEEIKGII